ncbi:sigma-54-dependent transcriptional regulator [endosymbiont of Ridgeia piscesae]|jgi:DNA-binding NtrC family response regulator|uniref:Two-component response regulator CbrB n=1 Tax=endosymbiont of Ridgeia piscesae TaxID=54398 RepID=A0A0T5YX66_9GAMM|nr:sigma-54 dependent transcriptional regulator [endosymbiont of Ridgeia piscesae]KRT54950.1 Two-component response regulator CbrB [endosymbiont of Ridgeia piscesae]KRT56759.1 Two-component response regulator CbrB [endosymbiont of Ridgeia piscesae]
MPQILIIEDEAVIRTALRRLLERHGFQIAEAGSVEETEALDLNGFDLIISDLRLPGAAGTEIIQHADEVPVLIMTSYASVRSAVEAMKQGAADYIAKPFDHDELLLLVRRLLRQSQQQRQQAILKSEMEKHYPVKGMVGSCDAMRDVCRRIEKVAPTDATVLILGESGTGKELVARALHEQSRRNQAPFIAFNCAAIPEHLIETELFGHRQGGEAEQPGLLKQANGGTLFLDEVGELPQAAQARLLRLLQSSDNYAAGSDSTSQLDVRIVAATHRDLRQLVQEQSFRSDLYFRLRVVEMVLPPLRERGNDIQALSRFLLDKTCKKLNKPRINLSRDALTSIKRYHWPGNVRELANAIERAVILCDGETITPDLLAIDHQVATRRRKSDQRGEQLSLEQYFRQFVLENQDQMTETEMARQLGISRKALWERRQRFGIPREKKKRITD